MKVPQQIIDRAIEAGIVTGAEVSCYITPSDTGIVPPVEKWEHGSGGWFFESGDEAIYVASDESDRFAKILQPAPQSQGLEEGMATECSPAMRAAIVERAKELGVPEDCINGSKHPNIGFMDGSIHPLVHYEDKSRYQAHKLIPNHEFLARLEATAKKPKPLKIGEWNVKFEKGSIEVGCQRITNETVRAIAANLKD